MTEKKKARRPKPDRKKKRRAMEAKAEEAKPEPGTAVVLFGRPIFLVNWDVIDAVLEVFGTLNECAAVLRCSPDTIEMACREEKGVSFSDYAAVKFRVAKLSIRRRQMQVAMGYYLDELGPSVRDPFSYETNPLRPGPNGAHSDRRNGKEQEPVRVQDRIWVPPDRSMLIWLGKQHLGQEDKPGIPPAARAAAELAALLGIAPHTLPSAQAGDPETER